MKRARSVSISSSWCRKTLSGKDFTSLEILWTRRSRESQRQMGWEDVVMVVGWAWDDGR